MYFLVIIQNNGLINFNVKDGGEEYYERKVQKEMHHISDLFNESGFEFNSPSSRI